VFVKPATLGSSVGMTKAHAPEELAPALNLCRRVRHENSRRTVRHRARNRSFRPRQPRSKSVYSGEIVPHREFYDYAAKYLEEGTQLLIPAELKPAQVQKIQKYAVDAFRALELSGMARVDFFLEKEGGKIFSHEVNTIPGFTSISMYPKLWEASGISLPRIDRQTNRLGLEQHAEKARTKYQIELPAGSGGALEA